MAVSPFLFLNLIIILNFTFTFKSINIAAIAKRLDNLNSDSDRKTNVNEFIDYLPKYSNAPIVNILDMQSAFEFHAATTFTSQFNYSTESLPLHVAYPVGNDVMVGLAAYKQFKKGFQRLIGSLRHSNYSGHIILGVSSDISPHEFQYLKEMNVTMYGITKTKCKVIDNKSKNNPDKIETSGGVRNRCAKGLESLTLEWGRYEMARAWITNCKACTGWALVMDTRDVFFQDHPFKQLGDPATSTVDLMFIEEISPLTSPVNNPMRSFIAGNPRNAAHTIPCYGKASYVIYSHKPVLCSGTVFGTRDGILRFLNVLIYEFVKNNAKVGNAKCQSPHTTDQWIMNWLYYNGKFGEYSRTVSIPWGTGPCQTVGKACMTVDKKTGAEDIVMRDVEGRIVNMYDGGSVAAVVHQFDRCGGWMKRYLEKQPYLN